MRSHRQHRCMGDLTCRTFGNAITICMLKHFTFQCIVKSLPKKKHNPLVTNVNKKQSPKQNKKKMLGIIYNIYRPFSFILVLIYSALACKECVQIRHRTMTTNLALYSTERIYSAVPGLEKIYYNAGDKRIWKRPRCDVM